MADGEPLAPDATYALDGDTELTAAMTVGLYTARQVWGADERTSDPRRGWRCYAASRRSPWAARWS